MYDWIRRVLSRPGAETWIILVSTLLVLPSVPAGLAADDFAHELVLSGKSTIEGFRRSQLDLFRFASPDITPGLIDDGVLPWWADPQIRFAFFRPLATATHWLDHVLSAGPVAMHLHTVLWSALSVLAARSAYRAIQGPGLVATLALLFYAIDDSRGSPVAWIANRNSLIAAALSIWALALHAQGGKKRSLAPLVLGLSLLANEGGTAVTPYLLAHALFLERGALGARLARLWPYAAVVLAWAAVYRATGNGIAHSGVYFDPLHDPVNYLRVLPERFAVLWLAQLGGPWSEGWNAYEFMFPGVEHAVVVLAVLAMAGAALLFAPMWRQSPRTRFWLTGALISTLPACGAFPADRLLPWVGVGAFGATAEFFAAYLEGPRAARGTVARVGAAAIVGAHLVLAPLLLPIRAPGIAQVRAAIDRADRTIPRDPSIANHRVVYVNPAADPFASYIPITRAAQGIPRPASQRWLSTGATAVTVTRVDPHTLRVQPANGLMLLPSERLFRDPRSRPFRVGETITTDGMIVTMTGVTSDGRPLDYLVRFDRALEDPALLWFAWKGDGYAPFTLPATGESVTLPPADLVEVAYGVDSPITKALRGR